MVVIAAWAEQREEEDDQWWNWSTGSIALARDVCRDPREPSEKKVCPTIIFQFSRLLVLFLRRTPPPPPAAAPSILRHIPFTSRCFFEGLPTFNAAGSHQAGSWPFNYRRRRSAVSPRHNRVSSSASIPLPPDMYSDSIRNPRVVFQSNTRRCATELCHAGRTAVREQCPHPAHVRRMDWWLRPDDRQQTYSGTTSQENFLEAVSPHSRSPQAERRPIQASRYWTSNSLRNCKELR